MHDTSNELSFPYRHKHSAQLERSRQQDATKEGTRCQSSQIADVRDYEFWLTVSGDLKRTLTHSGSKVLQQRQDSFAIALIESGFLLTRLGLDPHPLQPNPNTVQQQSDTKQTTSSGTPSFALGTKTRPW